MKNSTKYLLIFLILLLNSCGFTPMYKLQSANFYFSNITTNNENSQFQIFKNFMTPYINDKNKEFSYDLIIDLNKSKNTASKDSNGNPLVYLMIMEANVTIISNDTIIVSRNYENKFRYSHKSNIFDLNLYESDLEKNLIKKISEEIIIYLINSNKSASTSNNHNIKNIIIKGSSEIGYGTSS